MRKRKPPTQTLSCLVPQEMAEAVLAHGEDLNMIQTEIVRHLLCVAFYGDEALKDLEQRVLDAEARVKHYMAENEKLKQQNPRQSELVVKKFTEVLKNEEILTNLYKKYTRQSFPFVELKETGYNFDFQLSPVKIGGIYYSFLIQHGWGYADNTHQTVMIRRDY